MHDVMAVAMFCEDIREELNGMHSIIGVFGDSINVNSIPGVMPKLAIYIRIHFRSDFNPCEFKIYITQLDGSRVLVNTIDKSLVSTTLSQAAEIENPIAGVLSHIIASPFPVDAEGRIKIELEWLDQRVYLGGLNFKAKETITSPSALPPPPSQSPPSAQAS